MSRVRTFIETKAQADPIAKTVFALASDSAVYWAGSALIGVGNFILIPLYTRYLAPAEFGAYALVDIVVLIIVTITRLGLGISYLKWFADVGESRRGELLGSTLAAGMVAATLGGILLALAVASPASEHWLQTPAKDLAWTLLPIVILENLQGLLLADLRARRQPVTYSASSVGRLMAIVVASLWFIVVQEKGVTGIFLGRLVGDAVGVLLLAMFCLRATTLRLARSVVAPMVRYGLPLMWSSLVAMMLDAAGRYFLSHYSTMAQVGYYAAAIKIGNVFQMLVTLPFGAAWGGLMFQIAKWPNARTIYSKIGTYIFVLSLAAALVLALFAPTLFAIFATAAYLPGMMVCPLILLTRAINIMEYPAAIGLYLSGQTRWFASIYSVGMAVGLAADFLLVPAYGMHGAAWAWFASWVIITILLAVTGRRYYAVHYDWKLFAPALGLWGMIVLIGRSLPVGTAFGSPLFAACISLGVLVVVGIYLYRDFQATRLRAQKEMGDA
jgi:O-antigen/teichoic acid export membrane protein